jgi:hypothetical protein
LAGNPRPGRMHHATAIRGEGIDDLFRQFPHIPRHPERCPHPSTLRRRSPVPGSSSGWPRGPAPPSGWAANSSRQWLSPGTRTGQHISGAVLARRAAPRPQRPNGATTHRLRTDTAHPTRPTPATGRLLRTAETAISYAAQTVLNHRHRTRSHTPAHPEAGGGYGGPGQG